MSLRGIRVQLPVILWDRTVVKGAASTSNLMKDFYMTRRKVNLALLYASGAPAKWWRGIVAGMDGAVGVLCASQWQNMQLVAVARTVPAQRRVRNR
jgi:hypothetical protein